MMDKSIKLGLKIETFAWLITDEQRVTRQGILSLPREPEPSDTQAPCSTKEL